MPGYFAAFEPDSQIVPREATARNLVDETKIISLDFNDFISNILLECWHRLIAIPKNLRRAVFENIIFAMFDPDHAIC